MSAIAGWILMIGVISPVTGLPVADLSVSNQWFDSQQTCVETARHSMVLDSYQEYMSHRHHTNDFRIWCEPVSSTPNVKKHNKRH